MGEREGAKVLAVWSRGDNGHRRYCAGKVWVLACEQGVGASVRVRCGRSRLDAWLLALGTLLLEAHSQKMKRKREMPRWASQAQGARAPKERWALKARRQEIRWSRQTLEVRGHEANEL
ncbi:unnamed protein product [Ilex paraguariensis]|uniref:Uncharacterized protein n=1 Tax=Ilex paraguariensis TaxID=185542 RepID=A0ABC8RW28_9AQUA